MQRKRLDKKQFRKTLLYTVIFLLSLCAVLGLFALKAYAACSHQYVNGNCIHCGIPCQSCETGEMQSYSYTNFNGTNQHVIYRTCDECGLETNEGLEDCNFNLQNVCMDCGHSKTVDSECVFHTFLMGICETCGYECPHSEYQDSVCSLCGITCIHSNIDMHYNQSSTNIHQHILAPYCADCDIGLVTDHPDCAKAEVCSYDENGICIKCSRSCLHEYGFENGICPMCNYGCGHSAGSTYTYDPISSSTSYHSVKAWCVTCGELNTGDSQNGAHVKCTFINGECTFCKRACSHSSVSTSYSQISNDYALHKVIKTCKTCKQQVSSDMADHTYSGSTCSACNLVCTHERWTDGKCTYCSFACQHGTYEDYKCSICNLACNHPSTTGTVVYSTNPSTHKYIYYCDVCNFATKTIFLDHSFKNGKCNSCGYICTHSEWIDGACAYCGFACGHDKGFDSSATCYTCGFVCDHTQIVSFLSTPTYATYEYTCVCGRTFSYSRPNHVNHLVDFFRPVPFYYYRNGIASDNIDIIADNSPYNHVYTRVYIDKFVEFDGLVRYDYKVTAHMTSGDIEKLTLSNGYDYECISGRYLVLRLRMFDIDFFEFDLMGGMGVDDIDDYGYADYAYFDYDILPDNEWINLVVDLSTFSAFNGNDYAYVIGSQIDSFFLKICCAYDSADGFIDYEFYALCDDMSEVHSVCNAFNSAKTGTQLDIDTYLATSTSTTLIESEHEFDYFDGEMICWCFYKCVHEHSSKIDYQTDTHCGYTVSCDACGLVSERADYYHRFTDNSNTCSRCSYVCDHLYSSGVCLYCEWECIHNSIDGSIKCSNCGFYFDYEGYDDKDGFLSLFTAIYDAQANIFFKMLGYEILGVNVAGLIVSVIALAVVIWFLKKVL